MTFPSAWLTDGEGVVRGRGGATGVSDNLSWRNRSIFISFLLLLLDDVQATVSLRPKACRGKIGAGHLALEEFSLQPPDFVPQGLASAIRLTKFQAGESSGYSRHDPEERQCDKSDCHRLAMPILFTASF